MAPKIVLVTGCSTGIGLSVAILLANDKNKRFKVYATMRNLEKKGALEEQGKNVLGDTLIIKAMDVCSDDSVNAVVEELLADHQRIDVVSKSFSLSVSSTRFKVFIVAEHSSVMPRQLHVYLQISASDNLIQSVDIYIYLFVASAALVPMIYVLVYF